MEYQEEDYLLLSGIQHFVFCRRQWALIHIEQQWEENVRTFEGRVMHENAHNADFHEKRNGVIMVRAMKVSPERWESAENVMLWSFIRHRRASH